MSAFYIFNNIPLYYLFHSRLLTRAEKISWLVMYPLFLMSAVFMSDGDMLHFVIVFFGVMSVYEVGYLFNDFYTTKYESSPTVRCGDETGFYEKNFWSIIFFRVLVTVLLSVAEVFFYGFYSLAFFSSSILVTYAFHNLFRGRVNVITYFLLVSQRYIAPVFFMLDCPLFLVIVFLFPIPRTMEHACKPKYGFSRWKVLIRNHDFFRVKYYSFFALILLVLSLFLLVDVGYIVLALYFLIYRFVSYFFRDRVERQQHPAYSEDNE